MMSRKPRTVRLTDVEYLVFMKMGGVVWLRHHLHKVNLKQLRKADRNMEVRRRHAAGESSEAIADALGLARTTVWRICK